MENLTPTDNIPFQKILQAKENIRGSVIRSPLILLNENVPGKKIYIKLENLQPIGSFKIRGAGNALANLSEEEIKDGVYTASAGNFAQGLAWNARERGIPCNVIVPDHAPMTKLEAIERLGGSILKVPFDKWWEIIQTHHYKGMKGKFVHPVCDPAVIAGNGTIGLEIMEDLPEVDVVICPYGGGGLISGVASAVKSRRPSAQVFACEVDTASPLKLSFDLGKPSTCDYKASFVDGMGGKSVLESMWPLVSHLVDDSLVVTLEEVANAVKLLVERNRVVAEGAGAATVAAALSEKFAGRLRGNIVCVISGGNIDTNKLIQALEGKIPQ
ncbi:L-threonine ammonia-lyase-like [Saccostrea cucullata]|uniref:L-threonine ammonia-lyase-like n=1 Tax=Saccostrea cuccullata TaxID=36930 RepID=UPI002ED0709F